LEVTVTRVVAELEVLVPVLHRFLTVLKWGACGCFLPIMLAACSKDGVTEGEMGQLQAEGRHILIVTGEDYEGHHWRDTTPVLRKQLEADRRLMIDVHEDLRQLASLDLSGYAAVVMHFKNYDPAVPGRAGFENLAGYVGSGGGLVLVHFACGAFQEFSEEFEKLAGRIWNPDLRGHDPHGRFQVLVTRKDHPVTSGIEDFWTEDELYTCLDGTTEIEVLAEAVSKVDGKTYPMAFVLNYGDGRVFHSVLGHDAAALNFAGPAELLRRGTAWAAGLAPDE
jgi:uncharacterized protein